MAKSFLKAGDNKMLDTPLSKLDVLDLYNMSSVNNNASITENEPENNQISIDKNEDEGIRVTIVVNQKIWEDFKDLIYTKKLRGQYNYNQQIGVECAIKWLIDSESEILKRPIEIKEYEDKRKFQIKNGIDKRRKRL